MHGLRDPVRSSQRGDRYQRCGAILTSGWRAVHGTRREGFCPIFSLRLREGSMELQTASRLAVLSSVLSTETRLKCFAQAALWKFRLYWSLVGPFSGFMRKAILKQLKTETESRVEPNPPKVWTKE